MSERFPNSPEVIHWKAVTYHRWSSELILNGKLREAEIYLNKALNTDPKNRELSFEVKRDLERVQLLKTKIEITQYIVLLLSKVIAKSTFSFALAK